VNLDRRVEGHLIATAPRAPRRCTARKPKVEAGARAQVKRWHAELVVKGADGRILRRDSYGGDPARPPD
jgi:hypothetical protein